MTSKITTIAKYLFLTIASVISVFPLLWMVIAATNRSVDVIAGKLTFGTKLVENYKNLISVQPVWRSFGNSCKYALLVTVVALIVSSMAGYAFEVHKSKWKEFGYTVSASKDGVVNDHPYFAILDKTQVQRGGHYL